MIAIRAEDIGAPPAWAVKQRQLIETMNAAAGLFLEKYVHRGGTLRAHGKLDDDYECFTSWPLFYALGGGERLLDWSLAAWNGITRQWTYQHGQSVHKEFVKHYDMLHLSEAYVGFQNFGLADPAIPENIDRACRFAGFYLGEDPQAPNYDPQRRLIRSPITGSAGPAFSADPYYNLLYGHASLYPMVEELVPGWEKDPEQRERIQRLYDEVVIRGDVPMNLAITGLVSHAFILTGEEKYRRWVLDYVDAWMERIRENHSIIPDNVGLSGKIGEQRHGQWWGGFYGWTGRYSVWMICHALITATESAYLLSGDKSYLDLLRSQIDVLLDRAITRDGDLLVPYKMGPQGWHDYRPLDPYAPGHLWHLSMDPGDWERLERLRRGVRHGPHRPAAGRHLRTRVEEPDPHRPEPHLRQRPGADDPGGAFPVFQWRAAHGSGALFRPGAPPPRAAPGRGRAGGETGSRAHRGAPGKHQRPELQAGDPPGRGLPGAPHHPGAGGRGKGGGQWRALRRGIAAGRLHPPGDRHALLCPAADLCLLLARLRLTSPLCSAWICLLKYRIFSSGTGGRRHGWKRRRARAAATGQTA